MASTRVPVRAAPTRCRAFIIRPPLSQRDVSEHETSSHAMQAFIELEAGHVKCLPWQLGWRSLGCADASPQHVPAARATEGLEFGRFRRPLPIAGCGDRDTTNTDGQGKAVI